MQRNCIVQYDVTQSLLTVNLPLHWPVIKHLKLLKACILFFGKKYVLAC